MRAGRMRHRLRMLRPLTSVGKLGGEKVLYELTATVWAERVKMSPRYVQELGEFFSDYTVEYNIRDAHTVDEGWQVEEVGGHLYKVVNLIPNRERGMLTLRVERINV